MFKFWHGGARWTDKPQVQSPKAGRYEHGPGIYLTTHYLRAKGYAKGGKVTTLIELSPDTRWLHAAKLPSQELVQFFDMAPRLPNRDKLKAEFQSLNRMAEASPDALVKVEYLRNFLVNSDALSSKAGLYFAQWLVDHNIDAAIERVYSAEEWVVVFNPAVIVKHTVVPAANVALALYELPAVLPRLVA